MSRIIDFSLENRFLVVTLWVIASAVGIHSLGELPIDAVPDVTNVQVQVLTNSPGLPPEEVERFITFPVETAMSGLPSIEEIRSVSKFGLSVVTVVFEEGTDIYWARQLVSERLVEAREEVPRATASRRWARFRPGSARSTSSKCAAKGTRRWSFGPSSTGTSTTSSGAFPGSSR